MTQPTTGWHRDRIADALRAKYGPVTKLSVTWGYSRPAIITCLLSPTYSRPLELRIAEALDVSAHTLWPDRWDAEGNPRTRTRRAKADTAASEPARQKARAA